MNIQNISRRQAIAISAAALCNPARAWAAVSRPVLVELFTSQGCSSCPPADEFAAELDKDPNIMVVSFNVDYWDYLGWRDTLAKPEYSERQYDYAKTRGDGAVYTPQMVVNGSSHAVGSKQRDVSQHIDDARATQSSTVVRLSASNHQITVDIAKADFRGEATLWLMAVAPRVVQKIQRGENAGKDITYINVVKNLIPGGMWNGETFHGTWMRDVVMPKGAERLIAVLQEGKTGKVLGLAKM